MFRGTITAMITPFTEGRVDEARLRENVAWQIDQGVAGLVPCGTTGESPTLSHEEHERVVEVVVDAADGRVPVIAGAGSNSTAEALRLSRHAKSVGAAATLQVNPYYNKPTQEGLYRHFASVADQVDLPVVLYNIPGRSGVATTPATVARLADHENIGALKEATGSMDSASELATLCGEKLTILSGDDSMTLPLMAIGGTGVISVVSNLLPERVRALTDAAENGDYDEARRLHRQLFAICRGMLALETNPIPIKTAMAMAGRDTGELRLPMCEMAEDNRARLQALLREQGVIG